MEWTDQDMISAQNIPKKEISCWRKYFRDFTAQKVGFPNSPFGRIRVRMLNIENIGAIKVWMVQQVLTF
jgi:hypothetical protein